jgi:hypothetical protein
MMGKVLYILVSLQYSFLYSYLFFIIKLAAANGHTATCQLLIDKGSEVNVNTDNGWTPLHLGEY